MLKVSGLLFGTAGVPLSCPKPSSVEGIRAVRELGLDAMELEFVRGVRMSDRLAEEVRRVSSELGVALTAHAPYYINLNSPDGAKVEASARRIAEAARALHKCGGWSVVFHAAYYGGDEPEVVHGRVREQLKRVVRQLADEGVEVWVRPETAGGLAEYGNLHEVVRLSQEVEGVLPCIDFAHLHARTNGGYNSYDEISSIFSLLERELGEECLRNMHMHFSGIEYAERGEVRHVNLEDSDYNYVDLVRALRDFKVEGVIISESPNIEGDALLIKRAYSSALQGP
ncbi:MAG: TIM barrel protein [Candidatus Nezhaarchaeales archaeon]